MSHSSNIQVVLAAVINRGGRYLICQRPAHKRHGLLWEFPGGKREEGETSEQAIHRELAEELQVEVRKVGEASFTFREPNSNFEIHFVDVEVEGEAQLLEHAALSWSTLEELDLLSLAPSDRAFVEHLLANGHED